MNYKGYNELIPESHWIKVEGSDYFKCSECGHMQDIYKNGKACEECGTWMVMRLVKDKVKRDDQLEK